MGLEIRSAAEFLSHSAVESALRALTVAPSRAGFFFDFDGVLSPIQAEPESARPAAGVERALTALTGLVGRVALLSSRNAGFLRDRLGTVPGLGIHGLYGLEYVDDGGEVAIRAQAQGWTEAARAIVDRAARELPQVYVEDKILSVGLHYRLAPQARDAVEEWALRTAQRTGFLVQPGRMAVELTPPLDVDKGTTLTRLTADLDAAWYFGDDLGDLPAFAALHERAAAGTFSGLAVGIGNDTVVDEVRHRCDVFLASQELLVPILDQVIERLSV